MNLIGVRAPARIRADAGRAEVPRLFFEYDAGYDLLNHPNETQIQTPYWQSKVESSLGPLQADWDRLGAPLLRETVRLTGTPYRRKEETVGLTLSREGSGTSVPLVLQLWPYVGYPDGTTWDKQSYAMYVWHELLHRYIRDNVDFSKLRLLEPVRAQLEAEGLSQGEVFDAMAHVHLNALQMLALTRLGRTGELQKLIDRDGHCRGLPMPHPGGLFDKSARRLSWTTSSAREKADPQPTRRH